MALQNKMQSSADIDVDSYANIGRAEGSVGSLAVINGFHVAQVYNNTALTQTYSYTFSVCAQTADHRTQCGYYFDTVQLEPGGNFTSNEESTLQVQFDKPGIYRTWAQTYTEFGPIKKLNLNLGTSSVSSNEIEIK